MKKTGYKSNRPSWAESARRYEENRLKQIARIEEERRVRNEKRVAKGLAPIEYQPFPLTVKPLTDENFNLILKANREKDNKNDQSDK